MTGRSLESLRDAIRLLDTELIERIAERVRLARQVGEIKRERGQPTVDYAQERTVIERVRTTATAKGLEPTVAEDLFARIIRASVMAQEEDSLRFAELGIGKRAVIVGGAGRMGRWLGRFLSAQGYTTGALDPAASTEENAWARDAFASADLVICCAPPATIAELYRTWCANPPSGIVVDVASIKTPLIEPIRALQRAGCRVGSIHPMFGPSIVLLRDADVVICDTGDVEAGTAVETLFEPTTAHLVHVLLDDHDRMMADLLSLSHATAIAFALALPSAAHPMRSTTFQALESVAADVVHESPDVYYEIQAKNPHSTAALTRLRHALDRIVAAVASPEVASFRTLFEEGRSRTHSRR